MLCSGRNLDCIASLYRGGWDNHEGSCQETLQHTGIKGHAWQSLIVSGIVRILLINLLSNK
jgi:hypothetical protein